LTGLGNPNLKDVFEGVIRCRSRGFGHLETINAVKMYVCVEMSDENFIV
jgi:hypothetical protein